MKRAVFSLVLLLLPVLASAGAREATCDETEITCRGDDLLELDVASIDYLSGPPFLEFQAPGGKRIVRIDMRTGRVETELPYYEAAYGFWVTVSMVYPNFREEICGRHVSP